MVIFHGYVGSLKANLLFFRFRYVSNDGRHWFFRSAVSISLSRDSWFRWCKLDLDVSEVLQWLDLEGATGGDCRKSICSPIPGGPGGPGGPGAFYPKGIPRIFVSMGPTNELKRSREILEKVEKLKRRHALPRPILFQKAYRTGDEARKDWPDMGCLLWHFVVTPWWPRNQWELSQSKFAVVNMVNNFQGSTLTRPMISTAKDWSEPTIEAQ